MHPAATADALVHRYDDGELAMTVESAQLLTTIVRGVGREAMVLEYIRLFHAFVDAAPGPVDIFHDWYEVTTFQPAARTTFAQWGRERRVKNARICRSVHVLVRSPIVFLALEAGGIAKGYAHTHAGRGTFAAALQGVRTLGPAPPF